MQKELFAFCLWSTILSKCFFNFFMLSLNPITVWSLAHVHMCPLTFPPPSSPVYYVHSPSLLPTLTHHSLCFSCTCNHRSTRITPTPQNHVGLRDCSSCRDPCPSTLCGHQGRSRQMVSDWSRSHVWSIIPVLCNSVWTELKFVKFSCFKMWICFHIDLL